MTLRSGSAKKGNRSVAERGPQASSAMPKSLICHLDSTVESSVILSGAGVLEWRDISGNGLPMHFRQTTAANQPQWGTKAINGYTVLDWTAGTSSTDTPHMYCSNNRYQPVVNGYTGSRLWKGWHGGTSGDASADPGFTILCVAQHDNSATVVNWGTRLYGEGADGFTAYVDSWQDLWSTRMRTAPNLTTTQVDVTNFVATASFDSWVLPHNLIVGDIITTTGHTVNQNAATVTAVTANTVSYVSSASDGLMADGVGTMNKGDGQTHYCKGAIVNTNQTRVFTHKYEVANKTTTMYVDGVLDTSTSNPQVVERYWPNSGSANTYDHFAIGSNGDAYRQGYNTPWRGSIAEFMFFDESLPDTTRSEIEAALVAKWGL